MRAVLTAAQRPGGLADVQDRTFARATTATGKTFDRDWVGAWIQLRAERLLSYAAEGAAP